MQNESLYPPQTIDLPSKGKLYTKDHPLVKGTVDIKVMTAKEEDILTNTTFLKKGIAIDKMLQALVVDKFDYNTLLICDKNTIFLASRVFAYGKDYQFEYADEEGNLQKVTVDLTTLKDKEVDESLFNDKNEFTYVLPTSKHTVTFKLLTHQDRLAIDAEIEGLKKVANLSTGGVTTTLKRQIVAVDGDRTPGGIAKFAVNMLSRDSIALRKYINDVTPGLIFKADAVGEDGTVYPQIDIPITPEFFFPGGGI